MKKGGSDGQVGERKEKKRKRKKENGLLHWALVWATKMEVGSGIGLGLKGMGLGRRKWA